MKRLILIVMAVFTLSGCSKSAPKCSDAGTVKLASDIVKQEAQKMIPANDMTVKIDNIRTTGSDDKTGAQFCAGEALIDSVSMPAVKGTKLQITFKSELTDKKDQYVTVNFR